MPKGQSVVRLATPSLVTNATVRTLICQERNLHVGLVCSRNRRASGALTSIHALEAGEEEFEQCGNPLFNFPDNTVIAGDRRFNGDKRSVRNT